MLLFVGFFTLILLLLVSFNRKDSTTLLFPLADSTMDEGSTQVPDFGDLPLVTVAAPARNDGTLDVARCAALHDYLVRYGWEGMGHDLDTISSETVFEKHGEDAGESVPSSSHKYALRV